MRRAAVVVCVPAVGLGSVRVLVREGVDAADAVVLQTCGAVFAVGTQAGGVLGADADAVAYFDGLCGFGADARGAADDFVADADGCGTNQLSNPIKPSHEHGMDSTKLTIWSRPPPTPQRMDVTSTNPTMRNLNLDVGFLPGLWVRELLPDHVAFGGGFVEAEPAGEFGVGVGE